MPISDDERRLASTIDRLRELSSDEQTRLFLALPQISESELPTWIPSHIRDDLEALTDYGTQILALRLFVAAGHIGNDIGECSPRDAARALSWASMSDSGDRQRRFTAFHPLIRLRGLLRAHPDAWRYVPKQLRMHPELLGVSPSLADRAGRPPSARRWRL